MKNVFTPLDKIGIVAPDPIGKQLKYKMMSTEELKLKIKEIELRRTTILQGPAGVKADQMELAALKAELARREGQNAPIFKLKPVICDI